MYPLYKEVTRAFGTVAESKWAGAALNLFLYMLHSYVFGAFWYLSSIERKSKCWRAACARTSDCNLTVTDLLCKRAGSDNIRFLNTSCPLIDPAQITNSTDFDFGMYIDALKSGVLEVKPKDFPRKFVYCFWWGLRNIRLIHSTVLWAKTWRQATLQGRFSLLSSYVSLVYSCLLCSLETFRSTCNHLLLE